jgi:hypothetical protein
MRYQTKLGKSFEVEATTVEFETAEQIEKGEHARYNTEGELVYFAVYYSVTVKVTFVN